jgi:hypothetical protein
MDAMLDQLIKKTAEDIWLNAHNTNKHFNAPDFMGAFDLACPTKTTSSNCWLHFGSRTK